MEESYEYNLPIMILKRIFQRLPTLRDKTTFELVCSRWRKVAQSLQQCQPIVDINKVGNLPICNHRDAYTEIGCDRSLQRETYSLIEAENVLNSNDHQNFYSETCQIIRSVLSGVVSFSVRKLSIRSVSVSYDLLIELIQRCQYLQHLIVEDVDFVERYATTTDDVCEGAMIQQRFCWPFNDGFYLSGAVAERCQTFCWIDTRRCFARLPSSMRQLTILGVDEYCFTVNRARGDEHQMQICLQLMLNNCNTLKALHLIPDCSTLFFYDLAQLLRQTSLEPLQWMRVELWINSDFELSNLLAVGPNLQHLFLNFRLFTLPSFFKAFAQWKPILKLQTLAIEFFQVTHFDEMVKSLSTIIEQRRRRHHQGNDQSPMPLMRVICYKKENDWSESNQVHPGEANHLDVEFAEANVHFDWLEPSQWPSITDLVSID